MPTIQSADIKLGVQNAQAIAAIEKQNRALKKMVGEIKAGGKAGDTASQGLGRMAQQMTSMLAAGVGLAKIISGFNQLEESITRGAEKINAFQESLVGLQIVEKEAGLSALAIEAGARRGILPDVAQRVFTVAQSKAETTAGAVRISESVFDLIKQKGPTEASLDAIVFAQKLFGLSPEKAAQLVSFAAAESVKGVPEVAPAVPKLGGFPDPQTAFAAVSVLTEAVSAGEVGTFARGAAFGLRKENKLTKQVARRIGKPLADIPTLEILDELIKVIAEKEGIKDFGALSFEKQLEFRTSIDAIRIDALGITEMRQAQGVSALIKSRTKFARLVQAEIPEDIVQQNLAEIAAKPGQALRLATEVADARFQQAELFGGGARAKQAVSLQRKEQGVALRARGLGFLVDESGEAGFIGGAFQGRPQTREGAFGISGVALRIVETLLPDIAQRFGERTDTGVAEKLDELLKQGEDNVEANKQTANGANRQDLSQVRILGDGGAD